MAIDTVTKRYSIAQLGEDLLVLPHPDATVHVQDRLLFIGLYSGIAVPDEGGGGGGIPGAGAQMLMGLGI